GYLIKINNFEELDSEYLNYCLNSAYAKVFFLRIKTDGVSQSNINAKKLGKFEVPFCSSEEQQEIVRRVEALFKIADQIEERYQKARSYVDKLTQSILAKAFRGELVPQNLNDEPASKLLKRIQEEKDKQTKKREKKVKKIG
ncbi:MAG: restriction endonuclease subunit S, partial [Deltaproteobacteria bacterium]|nr:restriction endonuclease subunit S [Deltaproteobacteria bacterium]